MSDLTWGDARLPAAFWRRCNPAPNGCWTWTGAHDRKGYGTFTVKTKCFRAHRYSYENLIGPIADGHHMDHLCRTPCCVNPMHLEPVTPRENVMRGLGVTARNARKTHCEHGHEYTPENTRWRNGNQRACRTCLNQLRREARVRARQRMEMAMVPTPAEVAALEVLRLALADHLNCEQLSWSISPADADRAISALARLLGGAE